MPRTLIRPRHLTVTAMFATSAIMLTACGSTAAETSGEPATGGTIVYAHQQEPACVYGGWIEQAYLSYQVLDSLTSLDENGEAVPWLAEEWDQSDDGLTWTFELKKDVSFTDGTPLNAEAVAYNVQYWLEGGNSTALAWLEGYVSSAEATGETTLVLHLDKPYPLLAETVSQGYFGIQSPDALQNRTEEENCAAPIGSGAFIVDNWTRGERITLLRNDDYTSWPANAKNQGPAIVDEVDWRFVPDATTRATALKSDEVDAIYDIPAIEWSTLEQGHFELLKYVTPGRPQQISFNTVEGAVRRREGAPGFRLCPRPRDPCRHRRTGCYSLRRQRICQPVDARLQSAGGGLVRIRS